MSLRVGKEDVYFILPESRYSVSTRIDRYMEEDFTLYIKARCITESLEPEKESFLFSRNGMHSGISFYKDIFGEIFVTFTYWFKDKEGKPSNKIEYLDSAIIITGNYVIITEEQSSNVNDPAIIDGKIYEMKDIHSYRLFKN